MDDDIKTLLKAKGTNTNAALKTNVSLAKFETLMKAELQLTIQQLTTMMQSLFDSNRPVCYVREYILCI